MRMPNWLNFVIRTSLFALSTAYLPDLQEEAVKTVVARAESLRTEWV